jgi:hypothetical protein
MSFDACGVASVTKTRALFFGLVAVGASAAFGAAFLLQPEIEYLALKDRILLRGYPLHRAVVGYLEDVDWQGGEYRIINLNSGDSPLGLQVVPNEEGCPRPPGWSPDMPMLEMSPDGRSVVAHRVVSGGRWKAWDPETHKPADLAPIPCPPPNFGITETTAGGTPLPLSMPGEISAR